MHLFDGFFRSPSVEPLFSDAAVVQSILDFKRLARAQTAPSPAQRRAITSSCRTDLSYPSLAQAMPAGNLAIPL